MTTNNNCLCPPLSLKLVAVDTAAIENDRRRQRIERGFDAVAKGAERVVFLLRREDLMKKAKDFARLHGVQSKSVFTRVKDYVQAEVVEVVYLGVGLVNGWPTKLDRKVSLGKNVLRLSIRSVLVARPGRQPPRPGHSSAGVVRRTAQRLLTRKRRKFIIKEISYVELLAFV